MRLLFEIDTKDYKENGTCFIRPSVRGIVIRDGKIAMVHSLKYDYYKFPGGGAEQGENHYATLIREMKEETGLTIIPESIKEYGLVHRQQKGQKEDIFIQDNYYYFCETEEWTDAQTLDDYEADERFTLEFVTPQHAIIVNTNGNHGEESQNDVFNVMLERENRVLKMLMEEKYLNDTIKRMGLE